MSPFRKKARPSLHAHFVEPSGTGSTLAAAAASALGLRLIRRLAGAGRRAVALVAAGAEAPAVWDSALVVASMPGVDRAPITAAIRNLFISGSLSKII